MFARLRHFVGNLFHIKSIFHIDSYLYAILLVFYPETVKVYHLLPWTDSSALCRWLSSLSLEENAPGASKSFFKLVDSFGVIVIDHIQTFMLVIFIGHKVSCNNLLLSVVDTNMLLGIPLANVHARFKLLWECMDHVAILQLD